MAPSPKSNASIKAEDPAHREKMYKDYYQTLDAEALRTHCKNNKLDTAGTKADLVHRLTHTNRASAAGRARSGSPPGSIGKKKKKPERMVLGLDSHFFKFVLPLVVVEGLLFAYATASDFRTCQVVLALVGLWWCFAALWVEIKIEQVYPHFDYENPVDPEMKKYKPFCDFAPWAKCSKVLMSPPGRFLRYFGISKKGGLDGPGVVDRVRGLIDLPNPALGVAFFTVHLLYPGVAAVLPIPSLCDLFFYACCLVGVMSVWLGYQLFVVLGDFCIVCVSMYVINFASIPMTRGVCDLEKSGRGAGDDAFFGQCPQTLLMPFLLLDATMALAVLWLYCSGHGGDSAAVGNGKAHDE